MNLNDFTLKECLEDIKRVIEEDQEIQSRYLEPLYNHITNLQKENERLTFRVKELKYFNDILENKEIELLKENHELKEQKKKAIKYLKEWRESDGSQGYCTFDLLELLGGD